MVHLCLTGLKGAGFKSFTQKTLKYIKCFYLQDLTDKHDKVSYPTKKKLAAKEVLESF